MGLNTIRKDVQDANTNENFKNVYDHMTNTYLGNLTETEIANLNTNDLRPGVMVYDITNDAVKVMVLAGGVKTFKSVTVS